MCSCLVYGGLNARVGKGLDSDDVVGLYGQDMCNSNGSKLIELMQQLNLMLWNCREFCIEPQWLELCRNWNSIQLLIMLHQIEIY